MDRGDKVYRASVYIEPLKTHKPYYIDEGEISGVVVDGVPMVKLYDMLLPMSEGWRPTQAEAKRDAWRELVRRAGAMQALADAISDELLHDDLTVEEAAA